jgi:hypothetical protein
MTAETWKILQGALDTRDPIRFLEHLSAQIGYNAGYIIRLSEKDRERMHEIIRWHDSAKRGTQN